MLYYILSYAPTCSTHLCTFSVGLAGNNLVLSSVRLLLASLVAVISAHRYISEVCVVACREDIALANHSTRPTCVVLPASAAKLSC
jgi:hypothetical protein